MSLLRDWKDVLFLPIGSLDLALDGRWDQSCKGLARRHPLFTSILTGWLFLCVACRQTAPTAPAPPPGNPSQGAERVFRMGIMGPFTGPSARTGEEFRQAATMAFEKVHNKIGDYKIELVWIDEQSDPAKAARAYEEAVIRNKIEAGLLNWHSSVAVACMELTAKYKVPHFFGNGATEIVNEKFHSDPDKYGYWMAKMWPVPAKLSIAYVGAVEDAIKAGRWKPEMHSRQTVEVLALAYIGGRGSLWGGLIAALILVPLFEYLKPLMELRLIIYGMLLILVMVFYPGGLSYIYQHLKPSQQRLSHE